MRIGVCLFAILALSTPVVASDRIGDARVIQKDVRGAIEDHNTQISVGDDVYMGETVTTASESRARFTFNDQSSLQMGPSSRVRLDNFVYSGGGASAYSAIKGAFRFASSPAAHEPYEVKTPTATIGVRGTNFGVRVLPGRTDAVLYSGVIEACSIATGACRTLSQPCTIVTVTRDGVTAPKAVGRRDWSFDNSCKGAGPRGVDAPSEPPPDGPFGVPPLPSGFSWSGAYVGLSTGSAIGHSEFADPVPMRGAAFLGGLKFGYNWELAPNIVTGFEADSAYRSGIGGGSNGLGSISGSSGGYLGTFRARVGYAFNRALIYGTGGLAYGDIIAPQSFVGHGLFGAPNSLGHIQNSGFQAGYAFGGGLQLGIVGNLSVNAEYLFVRLTHDEPAYTTSFAPEPYEICVRSAAHVIRIGVSYGFSFSDLARAASMTR
jgi:outer membrane immunogenic protein